MNTLITFPDWVPWWVPMVLIVPALLYALAFSVHAVQCAWG